MSVKSFAETVVEGVTRYTRGFGIEQAEAEEAEFATKAEVTAATQVYNATLYGVTPSTTVDQSTAVVAFFKTMSEAGGGAAYFPIVSGKTYYRMKNIQVPSNVWIWQAPGVEFRYPTGALAEQASILAYGEWTATSYVENVGSIGRLRLNGSEGGAVNLLRCIEFFGVKNARFPWIDLVGPETKAPAEGNPPMIVGPTGGAFVRRSCENLEIDLITCTDATNQEGAIQLVGVDGMKIGSIQCTGGTALRCETDAVTGCGCDNVDVGQVVARKGAGAVNIIPHQNWVSGLHIGQIIAEECTNFLYTVVESMQLGTAGHASVLQVEPRSGAWKIAVVEASGKANLRIYNKAGTLLEETAGYTKASEMVGLSSPYVVVAEGANYAAGKAEKLAVLLAQRIPYRGPITIDQVLCDGSGGAEYEGHGNIGAYMVGYKSPQDSIYIGQLAVRNVGSWGIVACPGLHIADAVFKEIGAAAIEDQPSVDGGTARIDRLRIVNANESSGSSAVFVGYLGRWEFGTVEAVDTRAAPKTENAVEAWEGSGNTNGTAVDIGKIRTEGIAHPTAAENANQKITIGGAERGIATLSAGKATITAPSCTTTSLVLVTSLSGTVIGVGVKEREAGKFKLEATATSSDEVAWAVLT
jgi:hypothetical protein